MSQISFILKELVNLFLIPINFKTGRILTTPTVGAIFLTKKCNSRCKICEYWKNSNFDDELTTKQWFGVIEKLKQTGVKIINFTADGEILTRKDSFEIMNFAKNMGLQVTINTNGLLLDKYIEKFIDLNPMQIQVSLDAFDDDSYKNIRGVPLGFTKVKNNILYLKKRGFTKISVGSVLTNENLKALPLIQKFAIKHGFTYRITAFQFQGFNTDNRKLRKIYQKQIFIDKLRSVIKEISKFPVNNTSTYLSAIENYYLQDKYHPLDCIVGYYKVFILPNGDISLCNIMHNTAIIGNITSDESLIDIWRGDQAQLIRKRIKNKQCPSCWLSCFAEDNIRFSPHYFIKQMPYFGKKLIRLLK